MKGRVMPVRGSRRSDPGHDEEGLEADDHGEAGGHQLGEVRAGGLGDAQARPRPAAGRRCTTAAVPMRPISSPMAAKIMSLRESGMVPACVVEPEARPPDAPVPRAYSPGPAGHCAAVPRVQPVRRPGRATWGKMCGRRWPPRRTGPRRTGGRPTRPVAIHSMAMNRVKMSRAKPMSFSTADDHHGEAPGHQDRDEGPGVEDQAVAHPGGRDRQQLLLLGEVGGEEDAQQDLGHLDRLELDRPDVDEEPGPAGSSPPTWGMSGATSRTTAPSSRR